jgi:hypothetical protein
MQGGVIFDEKTIPLNLVGRIPTIENKTLTDSDTEYEVDLPKNTVKFTLQARGSHDVKLSFEDGESGSKYITIKSGASITEDLLDLSGRTLYLQSPEAGTVVEVLSWQI